MMCHVCFESLAAARRDWLGHFWDSAVVTLRDIK